MVIPFLHRSTGATAEEESVSATSNAAGIARRARALMRKLTPPLRPRGHRAADHFAHNAETRGKYSRMHNLENHSQKGLYKCGFLWYLHISNNSCY
ncbi:MAG: hypothetical protein V8S57_03005 [Oscillospiraceae bacterium]